jgi:hypothetical protein
MISNAGHCYSAVQVRWVLCNLLSSTMRQSIACCRQIPPYALQPKLLTLPLLFCCSGALGAVHFTVFSNSSVGYVLQSNSTVKYFKGSFQDPTNFFAVPMINAVGHAIAQLFANTTRSNNVSDMLLMQSNMLRDLSYDTVQWQPRLGKFPHPSLESGGMQLQGQILAVFIFASLMFGCVSQVRCHSCLHVAYWSMLET